MPSGYYKTTGLPYKHNTFEKGHKRLNTGKTCFKKGVHSKTEFKKGYKPSEETRNKLSLSRIGKIGYWRDKKGEKAPNWKNGITPTNKTIRNSTEYKLWQKVCFIRDDFTDQRTGISGGYLVVHHINNFADFPELRFAINNGITLGKDTHILFHKLYGRKNNTREQLEEFLKGYKK